MTKTNQMTKQKGQAEHACPPAFSPLRNLAGILAAICVIFVLLVTSIEAVCYSDPGYFKKEYQKYDVLSNLPKMNLEGPDSLMAVTEHMMKYLLGDKDAPKLQIEVTMDGTRRGFFSEREILHMEDVRALFAGAQKLRVMAIAAAAALLCLMRAFLCHTNRAFFCAASKGMLRGALLFLAAAAASGIIFATNFTQAFITFHHIFFTNDLWLLDPSVDMLINIVPEGFFFDTAARILGLFAGLLLFLCIGCGFILHRFRERKE